MYLSTFEEYRTVGPSLRPRCLLLLQDYVLPRDFSCPNGCVMRWEYVATQTCVPPGCNSAVCRGRCSQLLRFA